MDLNDVSKIEDFDKEELFKLFAYLQVELEAREIALAALKLNKTSDVDDEAVLKPLYDTQLLQLENLIASQRYAQTKMRDQLILIENKYLKVCEDLEDEKRKRKSDIVQDDDVIALLKKERDFLKSEVEYEKNKNKKLSRELKRVILSWKEQNIICSRQRMAAASLIKEKKKLFLELLKTQECVSELKRIVQLNYNDLDLNNNCTQLKVGGSSSRIDSNAKLKNTENLCEICSNDACIDLRQRLVIESVSRNNLKVDYDRLKSDYERLLNELNHSSLTNTLSNLTNDALSANGSPTIVSENQDITATLNSDIPVCTVTSNSTSQRCKPNPPMRRSSEITNSLVVSSSPSPTPFNMNILKNDENVITNITVNNNALDFQHASLSTAVSPDKSLASTPPIIADSSLSSPSSSSSRSLTPSPPPPPLPIQLHYPYPGMQSHVNYHTTAVANRTNANPFLVSGPAASRPISSSLIHPTSESTVKIQSMIPTNSPIHALPKTTISFSVRSNAIVRNQTPRKTSPVNIQVNQMIVNHTPHQIHYPQQLHVHPNAHNHYHHHHHHNPPHQSQSQPKGQLLIGPQFSQRVSTTTPSSLLNGPMHVRHHFPTYSTLRSQTASVITAGHSSVVGGCNSSTMLRSGCNNTGSNPNGTGVNPNANTMVVVQTPPSG